MALRNSAHVYTHLKLKEEIDRIVQEGESKGYKINKKQASLLAAEKSKRGTMAWEEALPLLAREGLI